MKDVSDRMYNLLEDLFTAYTYIQSKLYIFTIPITFTSDSISWFI